MTQEEAELQFGDWLEQNGQGRPLVRANDDWMNYAPPGEAKSSSSVKLTYGPDEIEGVYKSFKNGGEPHVWKPANGETAYFTDAERQRLAGEAASRTAQEKAKRDAALQEAINFYYGLEPASLDHPYLVKKRITRLGPIKTHNGELIIPVFNAVTEEFQTYQRILPDDTKLFPADTVKKGGFMMPGKTAVQTKLEGNGPIIIAEGYASGYPIHAATLGTVICALDCGNIKPVVEAVRKRFPMREIIIAADNDTKTEGNPGVSKANEAAALFGCRVAIPPPGDFWDLWDAEGETAVQQCIDAAKFPEAEPSPDVNQPSPDEAAKSKIQATPFEWIEPTAIPKRRWLYKPNYIRQFISLLISPGGIGKSSLAIVEALAMCCAKALLGITPEVQPEGRRLKVWYFNGEDPKIEIQRRFAAACKYYHLTREEVVGQLFLDTGREQPIIIAEEIRHNVTIYVPVVKEIIATITENKIDVMIVDPFFTCHHVNENDNAAIGRVAKQWAGIADVTKCAVMLVHHSRKTGGEGVTVEDGRGASALRDAARTARSVNTMTKAEAEKAGISEAQRRFYFRADIGKANMTPPAEAADWFRLENVDLGNCGDGDWFSGDHVGVVTAWVWPVANVQPPTVNEIARVQAAVRVGGPWRRDQRTRTEPWVGVPVARALGPDLLNPDHKRAVVKLIGDWVGLGYLKVVCLPDPHREPREYVEVGDQIAVVAADVGSAAENHD